MSEIIFKIYIYLSTYKNDYVIRISILIIRVVTLLDSYHAYHAYAPCLDLNRIAFLFGVLFSTMHTIFFECFALFFYHTGSGKNSQLLWHILSCLRAFCLRANCFHNLLWLVSIIVCSMWLKVRISFWSRVYNSHLLYIGSELLYFKIQVKVLVNFSKLFALLFSKRNHDSDN